MWEMILPFAAGAAVAWGTTYLQHILKARREDKLRAAEQKGSRVQADKDAVADLLAAMFDWHAAIDILGETYLVARRTQARLDWDLMRKYQRDAQNFGIVLTRARLAVRNPAARPALDVLWEHHARMIQHLILARDGQPSGKMADHFGEFLEASTSARQQLEAACLQWDGSLPSKGQSDAPAT